MKYSIPYTPGILTYLKSLPSEKLSPINDIYFSDSRLLSSSRHFSFSDEYWDELQEISKLGVRLHYVMNATYWDNSYYLPDGLFRLVDVLHDVWNRGCTMLTFNNTFLLRFPELRSKMPPFDLKLSVNNKVASLEEVEFNYKFNAIRHFILDRSINRNFDELLRIHEWRKDKPDVQLTLLAQEGCLPRCPWKQQCDMMISTQYMNTPEEATNLQMVHGHRLCEVHYTHETSDILKSPWIPPHSISRYDGIVESVKISGRMSNLDNLTGVLNAYLYQNSNITIGEFLGSGNNKKAHAVNLIELEENNFSNQTYNCKNKCSECNFCDLVMSKLMKDK